MNGKFFLWISCILFLLGGCTPAATHTEPLHILFIGNSYTFANQMPEIFASLAESGGHEVSVTSVAKGGFSLADHLRDEAILSTLGNQHWDYVILQEKSDIPITQGAREANMYPAVREFNTLVAAQGADLILFMPWAYRQGVPEVGLADYQEMQAEVTNAYHEIGNELGLPVAPVGIAWQSALQRNPQLQLWAPDGHHPSILGSLLAANVFYTLVFAENPAELSYTPPGVSEDAAQFVAEIVGENQNNWNLPWPED